MTGIPLYPGSDSYAERQQAALNAVLLQKGAEILGLQRSGSTLVIRFSASYTVPWVQVQVQTPAQGGLAAYNPSTYFSSTLVDCRESLFQVVTIADVRSAAVIYLIPVQYDGAGTKILYDGQSGRPDSLSIGYLPLPVYVAEEYGMVVDGTTDDGAAVNDAIADATITGGVVELPAGTIGVHHTNMIQVLSGVYLRGKGRGVTILKRVTGSANEILRLGNNSVLQSYLGVSRLTVDGARTSTTLSGSTPIARAMLCSQVLVEDFELKNSPHSNWFSTDVDHIWCTNVYSHDCNVDAFSFYSNCTDGHVTNYTGERSGDDGFALVSYDVGECQRWTLNNIILNSCGLNDGTGTIRGGGFKLAGCKHVTGTTIVTNGCANGTLIQSNETKKATDITLTGLNSYNDGQMASGANRNGLSVVSGCTEVYVQGVIKLATHAGAQVTAATGVILDLIVTSCGTDGVSLSNTGIVDDIILRGRSSLNQRSGYSVVGATNVEFDSCRGFNNNQGGNAATSGQADGVVVQSGAGKITFTGGFYGDTQTVPTQANGINFQTGVVNGVSLNGPRCRGNTNLPIRDNVGALT